MKTEAAAASVLALLSWAAWTQEGEAAFPAKETVLVIVDVQNDFAAPSGVMAGPRSAKVVDPIRTVLEKARAVNVPIIYTQDHHRVTDREIRAGTKPHTLEGTWGEQILDVIKPRPQDYVVQKNSFDPWFSSDELERILTRRLTGIRNAVIVGLVSDFCVYAAANGFGIRGYRVILPKDCTEASSDYGRDLLFRQMRVLYHAQLTDSESLRFK